MKVVVFVSLLLIASFVATTEALATKSCDKFYANEDASEWYVEYQYSEYDSGADLTFFYYSLTVKATTVSQKVHALSHWVLGTEACAENVLAYVDVFTPKETSLSVPSYAYDPTTKIYGFKFEDPICSGSAQCENTVWTWRLAFKGRVTSGTVSYSVKGSTNCYVGQNSITGPACKLIEEPKGEIIVSDEAKCQKMGLNGGVTMVLQVLADPQTTYLWSSDPTGTISDETANSIMLQLPEGSYCNKVITVSCEITNEYGLTTTVSKVITVKDEEPPALDVIYTHETTEEQCSDLPELPYSYAFDACEGELEVKFEAIPGTAEDGRTMVLRHWYAMDSCGWADHKYQTILLQDTEAPVFEGVGEDVTVECAATVPLCQPIVTDNCDKDVELTFFENTIEGSCDHQYTIVYSWVAEDDSGNKNTATQKIIVRDTGLPQLHYIESEVMDMTVECNEVPTLLPEIFASDECKGHFLPEFFETRINGTCDNEYQLIRIWTADDDCGNSVSLKQVVNVIDTRPPTLVVSNCGEKYSNAQAAEQVDSKKCKAVVKDECDPGVIYTQSQIRHDGTCPYQYDIETIYSAVDVCGNAISMSCTTSFEDTVAPWFKGAPQGDETVQCDANIPTYTVTAEDDNSPLVVVVFTETKVQDDACRYHLERLWVAVDDCGNRAEKTQKVFVEDTISPTLQAPADVTVPCDRVPTLADLWGTDNCDGVIPATGTETRTNGECEDRYVLTRVWYVEDACGNGVDAKQVITVTHDDDPVFNYSPEDATYECDDPMIYAEPTMSGKDKCDPSPIVTPQSWTEDGSCTDAYIIHRTWTLTNRCGRTDFEDQDITVVDTTAPWFTQWPESGRISCEEDFPAEILAAEDNCDLSVSIRKDEANSYVTDGKCEDEKFIHNEWIAEDNCGNFASAMQELDIYDQQIPVIHIEVEDYSAESCEEPDAAPAAWAEDNCDETVDVDFTETFIIPNEDCAMVRKLVRTWDSMDRCGNAAVQITQTITFWDTTSPVFVDLPEETEFDTECPDYYNAPPLHVTDCGETWEVEAVSRTEPGNCPSEVNTIWTWTTSDCSGNPATFEQLVHMKDTTDPSLVGVPEDTTIDCTEIGYVDEVVPESVYGEDSCQGYLLPSKTQWSETIDCPQHFYYYRRWVIDDLCGHVVSATQKIEVVDETAPEIYNVPEDSEVSCPFTYVEATNVYAEDDCDYYPSLQHTVTKQAGSCDDTYALVVTYSTQDACGNPNSKTYVISVSDTVPPYFQNEPVDLTFECKEDPAEEQPAFDACDTSVDVTLTEVRTDGKSVHDYTVLRTWVATDNCGNKATIDQLVTVQDTKDPMIFDVPADEYRECDDKTELSDAVYAQDACGDPALTVTGIWVDGSCIDEYQFERTWVATDVSGNSVSGSQTTYYQDTTNPEWENFPVDQTHEWFAGYESVFEPMIASDNCDLDVKVSCTRNTYPNCPPAYTEEYYCIATDNCGNWIDRATYDQVTDFTSPEIDPKYPDVTVECDDVPEVPSDVTCDGYDVNFVQSDPPLAGSCPDAYTIVRSWNCQDDCGNPADHNQIITVQDNFAPTFTFVPGDKTVDCLTGDKTPGEVEVDDNCDENVDVVRTVTFIHLLDDKLGNLYVYDIKYTWTATDNCGNSETASQVVHVVDTTPPEFVNFPADVPPTQYEDTVVPTPPTVTDDCDCVDCPVVTWDYTTEEGTCLYQGKWVYTYTTFDQAGHVISKSQTTEYHDVIDPELKAVLDDGTWSDALPLDQGPLEWTLLQKEPNLDEYGIPLPPEIICVDSTPVDGTQYPVEYNAYIIPGTSPHHFKEVREWTCKDDCGNDAYHVQTIVVQETTNNICIGDVEEDVYCDNIPTPDAMTDKILEAMADKEAIEGKSNYTYTQTFTNRTQDDGHECIHYYTLLRTWIVEDIDGNWCTTHHTINVRDGDWPQFTTTPESRAQIECDEEYEIPELTATDLCDLGAPQYSLEVPVERTVTRVAHDVVDSEDFYYLVYTWTAEDACGHVSQFTQSVEVIDTHPPTWDDEALKLEAEVTLECNDDLTIIVPEPQSFDNCDPDPYETFTVTETSLCGGQIDKLKQYVYTWTTTDRSGLQSPVTVTQTITVVDTTNPVIVGDLPEDSTIECDVPLPEIPEISAIDACDHDLTWDTPQRRTEEGTCGDEKYVYTTYTVHDDCGNSDTYSYVITVVDTTAPQIQQEPNRDDECGLQDHVDDRVYTIEDNCDVAPYYVTAVSTVPNIGCLFDEVRTVTGYDRCGNSAEMVYTIHVRDTTDPKFDYVPDEVTYECSVLHEEAPVASDNCAEFIYPDDYHMEVANTPTVSLAGMYCDYQYDYVRSWYVEDACGHRAEASHVIHVVDESAPNLSSVDCDQTGPCYAPPVPTEGVTAWDNCDPNPVVTRSLFQMDICTGGYIQTYVWYATDACGNEATATQMLTVEDRDAPVFFIDGELAVGEIEFTHSCDEAWEHTVTVQDRCDEAATVTCTDEKMDTCGLEYSITRTCTAKDSCGNVDSLVFYITVFDTYNPEFEPIDEVTVNCNEIVPDPTLIYTHPCDKELVLTGPYDELDGTCSYTYTRYWQAEDDCGHFGYGYQVVNIVDKIEPVFDQPAPTPEITIGCDESIDDYPLTFTAHDECEGDLGEIDVQYGAPEWGDCYEYRFRRFWVADDGCGNTVTYEQFVNVVDETAPEFDFKPEERTIPCNEEICGEPGVTAHDNCDGVVDIDYTSTIVAGPCPYTYDQVEVWVATDDCENSISHTRVVHFEDIVEPVVYHEGELGETSQECATEPIVPTVWAEDNCGSVDEVTSVTRVDGSCEDTYDQVYTWLFTDECQLSTPAKHTIHYADTTAPVLTIPESITVACHQYVPFTALDASATDNCDDAPVITMTTTRADGDCLYNFVDTNVYRATDRCGNFIEETQAVTVIDVVAPELVNLPDDATLECIVPEPVDAVLDDNCSGRKPITPTVSVVDGTCDDEKYYRHHYYGEDDCGLFDEHTTVYHVQDSLAPTLVCPTEFLQAEINEIPCADEPTATDACLGDITARIVFSETIEEGTCDHQYNIRRTWSVSDNCGHSDECLQIISVSDTIKPELTGLPQELYTTEYQSIPLPAIVDATDNSGYIPDVIFTETRLDGPTKFEFQLLRTWTATDRCGNSAEYEQLITVIDKTAPRLFRCPPDITAECDNYPAPASVVTDEEFEVEFAEYNWYDDDGYYLGFIRTWTVKDDVASPNENKCTQYVTIADTTAPCLSREPEDVTVSCDAIPNVPYITAQDNCDEYVEVDFLEYIEEQTCEHTYTIVRQWSGKDSWDNGFYHEQRIFVVDDKKPEFIETPEAVVEVKCEEYTEAPLMIAVDNCALLEPVEAEVSYEELACTWNFIEHREWTVTDFCSHTTVFTQDVTVVDVTAPRDLSVDHCLCANEEENFVYADATTLFNLVDNCHDVTVNLVFPYVEVDGEGDYDFDPETKALTLKLVAGVKYTVKAVAVDSCGNETPTEVVVTVEEAGKKAGCDNVLA